MTERVAVTQGDLRPERPGRRRRDAIKLAGNVLYFVFFGLLVVISLILGVGSASSGTQRTYWGTFTQHSCEPGFRGRCEGVGTWVSDNGSIVKKNIQLDGDVNSEGTARAIFTPTGFNNDAENNIVHTSAWAWAKFWLPWAMTVLFGGLILFRLRAVRRRHQARCRSGAPNEARSGRPIR